jgi:two-component system, LuxR family, sensor kinase FixL
MSASYVTIIWSMTAAAALLLGLLHALVWVLDRQARPSLAFSILAFCVAGVAAAELGLMEARTVHEWIEWARWIHLPIFGALCAIPLFVRFYLGTGRIWLLASVITVRAVVLFEDLFTRDPTFNFSRITSIAHIQFLGQQVAVIGEAATSSRQWLALLSLILVTAFIVDACVTCWRQGALPNARRSAVVIGGSVLLFILTSVVLSQLVVWGLVQMPVIMAPPFLIPIGAMAFELSRETLRAAGLRRDLGESELKLELAATAANLGLWVWQADLDRMWVTERARALLGFSSDEVIGLERWIEVVDPGDATRVRNTITGALGSHREFAAEYRVRKSDGTLRWVAVRGHAERDAAGKPSLVRGVIRDTTDQKKAQSDLDELHRELAHAGRVSMLGQLASALAHELSQPLAAILRNAEAAEMLLQHPSPDLAELRSITADIRQDDRRAGDVIDRLRALLKRRRMELLPIAIESLIQDVSVLVRADAVAKQVELERRIEAGLPLVAGDRVHLSQVLINLIINAMDAIADLKSSRRIIIEARSTADQRIKVGVIDTGPGVPAEIIHRVFEPFFTTKSGGMGMGLSVSRTIIEAHGGQIWVENNSAGGATFGFTLPATVGARQWAA